MGSASGNFQVLRKTKGKSVAVLLFPAVFGYAKNMADDDDMKGGQAPERETSRGDRARQAQAEREAERKAKAAAKLRENLMRRKSQARARRAGEADETQGLPASRPSAAKSDESS
jgi:hypothetical protein